MNINKVFCMQLLTLCLFFVSITNLHATQAAPASKQPEAPLTVTVVQTEAASPQTLNQVPVKITIANNADRAFVLMPPYFSNVSFLNADITKTAVGILMYGTGQAAKNMAATTGCVLLGTEACIWLFHAATRRYASAQGIQVSFIDEPTLEQIAKFAMYCGIAIGAISEISTIIRALTSKIGYALSPHEAITIQGYIPQTDFEKIQDNRIKPNIIATALENCEDAVKQAYNTASTAQPI